MGNRPTKVTSTKLTPGERQLVEAGAKATGATLSAFVRAVLVPATKDALQRRLVETQ
jgi:uncharacterized protein (DUF1778 family)